MESCCTKKIKGEQIKGEFVVVDEVIALIPARFVPVVLGGGFWIPIFIFVAKKKKLTMARRIVGVLVEVVVVGGGKESVLNDCFSEFRVKREDLRRMKEWAKLRGSYGVRSMGCLRDVWGMSRRMTEDVLEKDLCGDVSMSNAEVPRDTSLSPT